MDQFISIAVIAVFATTMLFATFYDLLTMRIPNQISLILIGSFFILGPMAGMGIQTMLWSLGVASVVFACAFSLYCFRIMGGGDVKLLTSSALWFGVGTTVPYLLTTSLLGGVLTALIIIMRRFHMPASILKYNWIARLTDKSEGVPYGAAMGPAALLAFVDTPWMEYIAFGTPIG